MFEKEGEDETKEENFSDLFLNAGKKISTVFNQPSTGFVLLPAGKKKKPRDGFLENPYSFQEIQKERGKRNVGIIAGNGYIIFDVDGPSAIGGLDLPKSTTWETRPGRYAIWFKCDDSIPSLVKKKIHTGKCRLSLFNSQKLDEKNKYAPAGEIKLQRTYQVIPPSWKFLDEKRVEYRFLDGGEIIPQSISLLWLLDSLQEIGIFLSSKPDEKGTTASPDTEEDETFTNSGKMLAVNKLSLIELEISKLKNSQEGDRNNQLNRSAFLLACNGVDYERAYDALIPVAHSIGLEASEIEPTFKSGFNVGQEQWFKEKSEKEVEHPTDLGNAKRFVRDHKGEILYCFTRKKWLIWDGFRWVIDKSGEIRRLAKAAVAGIYKEASDLNDESERKALANHAMRSESRQHIDAMLNLAESEREFAKIIDDFDQDKWVLGVRNGTINLKTCEFQEARKEDMISMSACTIFDPDAKCERWKAFLKEVLVDDELIAYIQREVGYTLTGDTSEQSFRLLYGGGANGKTVFITVIQALLGDYAKNTPFTTFLIQRGDRIRNDLAALRKARLITASEPRKGSKFDLSVLKDWTGSTLFTARFLYGEFFTFLPEGKIWLIGNNKPIIDETTYAAWRRVRLIPFTVQISKEKQNPQLADELIKEELPGILNWALAGLKEWHKIGSKPPSIVVKATEEYRKESDSIGAFIDARCQITPTGACYNKILYQEYKRFCDDTGFDIESQKEFSVYLKKTKGIRWKKSYRGVVWHGIDLIPDGVEKPSYFTE